MFPFFLKCFALSYTQDEIIAPNVQMREYFSPHFQLYLVRINTVFPVSRRRKRVIYSAHYSFPGARPSFILGHIILARVCDNSNAASYPRGDLHTAKLTLFCSMPRMQSPQKTRTNS